MSKKSSRIAITNEIIETLLYHQHRTGVGPQKLLRGKHEAMPVGLSSHHIHNWVRRSSKSARKEHLDFVLNEWEQLPDNLYAHQRHRTHRKELESIAHDDLEKLKVIRDMTGIFDNNRMFSQLGNIPIGLNFRIVNQWLCVKHSKARPEDVKWVLESCEKHLSHVLQKLQRR